MISENSSGRQEPRGLRRFARDVGVNVLANLVAAAIIYLLGVLVGVLPSDPRLIGTALFFVFGTLFFGLYIASRFLQGERRNRLLTWTLISGGGFVAVGGLIGAADHEPWPRWATVGLGAYMVASGMLVLTMQMRSIRRTPGEPGDRRKAPGAQTEP